jgi:hypothetical protein
MTAPDDHRLLVELLRAARAAEAAGEELDLQAFAVERGVGRGPLESVLSEANAYGLAMIDGCPPTLLRAGRQFAEADGHVAAEVLAFLPDVIDDLHARRAMIDASILLLDDFRAAVREGHATDHAATLVPPAFVMAVDAALAVDLYAATVALMVRLGDGLPAGCVAEEIIGVRLLEEAAAILGLRSDAGELSAPDAAEAVDALEGLFEVFEDDDVLALFAMTDPADAAVAGHAEVAGELGIADQRVEAWFTAFGGVAPVGYLRRA